VIQHDIGQLLVADCSRRIWFFADVAASLENGLLF